MFIEVRKEEEEESHNAIGGEKEKETHAVYRV
jgi:hypothetical protein